MAYDWLGTFNQTQFERFLAFARSQLPMMEARKQHLEAERARIGFITFRFDENHVPNHSVATSGSYIAKILAAYEVLGGNPFLDLKTRNKDQAVFVVREGSTGSSKYASTGEPLGTKGLLDARSAELVRQLRQPLLEAMGRRFNSLERKLRRALDYSDTLEAEYNLLTRYQEAVTVEGSLEEVAQSIQSLISDKHYRAIYNDGGSDPLGLNTYAPFAQYDVDPSTDPNSPSREAPGPQRQNSGFIAPGKRDT